MPMLLSDPMPLDSFDAMFERRYIKIGKYSYTERKNDYLTNTVVKFKQRILGDNGFAVDKV